MCVLSDNIIKLVPLCFQVATGWPAARDHGLTAGFVGCMTVRFIVQRHDKLRTNRRHSLRIGCIDINQCFMMTIQIIIRRNRDCQIINTKSGRRLSWL
jgi:hypothetical protein